MCLWDGFAWWVSACWTDDSDLESLGGREGEFDNAFLFLSLPAVAYAVSAVAATDGGAGKADTVDWHPNSSNKMLALPGLLCYYPGCVNRGSHSNFLADSCHSLRSCT